MALKGLNNRGIKPATRSNAACWRRNSYSGDLCISLGFSRQMGIRVTVRAHNLDEIDRQRLGRDRRTTYLLFTGFSTPAILLKKLLLSFCYTGEFYCNFDLNVCFFFQVFFLLNIKKTDYVKIIRPEGMSP